MEKRDIIVILCALVILISIVMVVVLIVSSKKPSTSVKCITPTDCGGLACYQGKCVPCSSTVICPSGMYCDNGLCKTPKPDPPLNLQEKWLSKIPSIEKIKNYLTNSFKPLLK